MKKLLFVGALIALAVPAASEPVDMTGLSCTLETRSGTATWEFYGQVAIRYYQDGSFTRLPRIGTAAYETFDRQGEWNSVFSFFDVGDGIQLRLLARPGLIARSENPFAPMESGVIPFNASCVAMWE